MDDPCQGPIPVCVTPLLAARGQSHSRTPLPRSPLHQHCPLTAQSHLLRGSTQSPGTPPRTPAQQRPRPEPASGLATPAARGGDEPQAPPPQQRGTAAVARLASEARAGSPARGRGEFLLQPPGRPALERSRAASHRQSAALLSKPNGDKQEDSSGAARRQLSGTRTVPGRGAPRLGPRRGRLRVGTGGGSKVAMLVCSSPQSRRNGRRRLPVAGEGSSTMRKRLRASAAGGAGHAGREGGG